MKGVMSFRLVSIEINYIDKIEILPVTCADEIFRPRGKLFTLCRGSVEVLQKKSPDNTVENGRKPSLIFKK